MGIMPIASKTKLETPGPGAHDLPTFPAKHPTSNVVGPAVFTMAQGRQEPTARNDRVGPGQYHPKHEGVERRPPGWGFGCQKRVLSEPSNHLYTPAAQLGQVDNENYKRAPRYGFGSSERVFEIPGMVSERRDQKFKTPGPGQHNPNDTITTKMPSIPSFSVVPRRPPKSGRSGPGPGSYEQTHTTRRSTPNCKFSAAGRMLDSKKKTPGPGQYTTSNATRTGHSSIGDSAPRWSMPGRTEFDFNFFV